MSTFFHRSSVAVAVALLAGAACTVHETETPALTGPSSFGGTVVKPVETPTPVFTETPTPVNFNIAVTFDASTSCGGRISFGACSNSTAITKYEWDFGDGSTGTGKTTTHVFKSSTQPSTTFNVTLTVTNDQNVSASTTRALAVGASPAPSASFVASPTAPLVGQTAYFDANASRAAAGHSIVEWDWDFGDGVIASGSSLALTTHTYSIPATYVIVLKVVDEAGQVGTASSQLAVGSGKPVPLITFSPGSPTAGTLVAFNSDGSTASGGASIVAWAWDFGDPNSGAANNVSSSANPTHTFTGVAGKGTFTVRLTVTDNASPPRSGTTTITVTVN